MSLYMEKQPGGQWTTHLIDELPIYKEVCKQMAAHRKLNQPNIAPIDFVRFLNSATGQKHPYDPILTPEKERILRVITGYSEDALEQLDRKLSPYRCSYDDREKVIDEFFASAVRLASGIVAE